MNIRNALHKDLASIINLITELAIFEKQPKAVVISEKELEKHLFLNGNPTINCLVAEVNNSVVGIALFYFRFSTWKGKTIHLEDLIINENHRNKGIGKKLFNEVVKISIKENVGRMEWEALHWNKNALDFYSKAGAELDKDWVLCKLQKDKLINYKF